MREPPPSGCREDYRGSRQVRRVRLSDRKFGSWRQCESLSLRSPLRPMRCCPWGTVEPRHSCAHRLCRGGAGDPEQSSRVHHARPPCVQKRRTSAFLFLWPFWCLVFSVELGAEAQGRSVLVLTYVHELSMGLRVSGAVAFWGLACCSLPGRDHPPHLSEGL